MKSVSRFLQGVRAAIERDRLFQRGDGVVVAVSGGADSMALLHALVRLRRTWALTLAVGHVQHGLREDAEHDAAFVSAAAAALGLPARVERLRLRGAEAGPGSLEERARRLRYAALGQMARAWTATVVATGHTLDDQAETVLMRIIRGTGLRGLAGIPPVACREGLRIVRPLLLVRRSEVEAFLDTCGVSFREDTMNADPRFMRNRVRRVVLPWLERLENPRLVEGLGRLGQQACAVDRFLRTLAEEGLQVCRQPVAEGFGLDVRRLAGLPEVVRREVLRRAVELVRGDTRGLTAVHWEALGRFLRGRGPPRSLTLPGGVEVRCDQWTGTLARRSGRRTSGLEPGTVSGPREPAVGAARPLRRERLGVMKPLTK